MGKRRDISELYIKKGKTFIKLITLLVRSWAAQQLAELLKYIETAGCHRNNRNIYFKRPFQSVFKGLSYSIASYYKQKMRKSQF